MDGANTFGSAGWADDQMLSVVIEGVDVAGKYATPLLVCLDRADVEKGKEVKIPKERMPVGWRPTTLTFKFYRK